MSDHTRTDITEDEKIKLLALNAMQNIPALLQEHGLKMNDEQLEKLSTHMLAMAKRSITGESLPDFDKELFEEISSNSIETARSVVKLFQNLPDEEALILSIHFEMAQNN